jgi:hypothetical protein
MVDSTKLVFAIVPALLVGIVSMAGFMLRLFPTGYMYLLIPAFAYQLSIAASSLHQYLKCNKVEIQSLLLSNLTVLATSAIASVILFLENVNLKSLFFDSALLVPSYPTTGDPVPESSPSYKAILDSGAHLKFQLFSPIVRAVLPVGVDAGTAEGLIYFYYMFWMVLLPMYFLLGVQGFCN